jgi:predicted metal-binding membrane protein
MAAMGMSASAPWTAADVAYTFAMWAVMMVGMMTGTAAPVLLMFMAARQGRGLPVFPIVPLFGLGYLAVWIGFSAAAAMAQWTLHEAALLTPAMATSSAQVAGAILLVAGAYELTPFKSACLSECRSPLAFLLTHWRDGNRGAFVMGVRHGIYCLGCCWALMGLLFVMGVMSLVWVAALTAFVLLEKLSPANRPIAQVAGVVLIAAGLTVLVRG